MTNEAHNGYIEMYLNLGWIGLGLIALILGHGYRKAVSAFRSNSALGALLLGYVAMAVAYNIGEAGFRMLDVAWIFLLLAIVAANRVVTLAQMASGTAQELADPALLVRRHGHLPVTAAGPKLRWLDAAIVNRRSLRPGDIERSRHPAHRNREPAAKEE